MVFLIPNLYPSSSLPKLLPIILLFEGMRTGDGLGYPITPPQQSGWVWRGNSKLLGQHARNCKHEITPWPACQKLNATDDSMASMPVNSTRLYEEYGRIQAITSIPTGRERV